MDKSSVPIFYGKIRENAKVSKGGQKFCPPVFSVITVQIAKKEVNGLVNRNLISGMLILDSILPGQLAQFYHMSGKIREKSGHNFLDIHGHVQEYVITATITNNQ